MAEGASGVYLGNLLHVCNHLIVALGLFAQPGQEGLRLTLQVPKRVSKSFCTSDTRVEVVDCSLKKMRLQRDHHDAVDKGCGGEPN